MSMHKNILITPLNWGLGHATRCVPIIKKILEYGDNPIVAADKAPLAFLQKAFVGIHPSFRHVPPRLPDSISTTSTPLFAASKAVS